MMARDTVFPIVLLLLMLSPCAVAADLPAGNCAMPRALTDLSRCDFSRQKLAGKDLHGAKLAGAKLESADLRQLAVAFG